jgi:glycosyltransferase involved in cell wall biosynthesis
VPGPASPAGSAAGPDPGWVAFVVGTTAGGTGAHVRMLASGLAGQGIGVSVLGPSSAADAFGFGAIDGVIFSRVEFGDRPRARDVAAILRLRHLLRSRAVRTQRLVRADQVQSADVVHAHGLRAGALTALATAGLPGRGRRRWRPGLVVTVHNAPPAGRGVSALIYRVLESVVAHRADLVLCVSADLEARMRSAGARRTGRAIVPAATSDPGTASAAATAHGEIVPPAPPGLDGASAAGRPVVLAVGRLAAQKGFDVLLDVAAHWRDLDPAPLLAIAGDGPLAGELRARAASLGVDVTFLGRRGDVADLLAAAAVFVLPSRWEGQPLILQEALRAGAAIVATEVGGTPDLVGDDAALLVPPDDAPALAAAVRAVLTDAPLAARLRTAASHRGTALPTADDAVAAALAAYAQVLE